VSTANTTLPTTPAGEPAGLARRCAAFCYDLLLLAALIFCFTLMVLAVRGGEEIAPGTFWYELSLVAIALLFFSGFWTHGGQTLGMRAWTIQLVTTDGQEIGWKRAAARFFAAAASALPAGLGLWWSAFDPQGRGWHDRLTRTLVVRTATQSASARAPEQWS
jgi:uncharacterized RDD family membrane protein YckC